MELIDGKQVSRAIREEIRDRVSALGGDRRGDRSGSDGRSRGGQETPGVSFSGQREN